MSNSLIPKGKIIRTLEELISLPGVQALSQYEPLIIGPITTYFATKYSQEQFDILASFLTLVDERVKKIEAKYIDKSFIKSDAGLRIVGKAFKNVVRDNRKEKIEAMANLTVNLNIKTDLAIDEKELYVDILDKLNSLQLAIMQKGVTEMRGRNYDHRGFGYEIHADYFAQLGISKPLLLQSIRVLESNGLVNQNTAEISEANRTHYITDFGEKFIDFTIDLIPKESKYLRM